MKLVNVLTLRLSVAAALVLAFWSVLFYFAIISEINDETDDSLEDHAELLIQRALAGEPLPETGRGTNNEYFMHEVSLRYADTHSHIRYEDSEIYIEAKREYEPSRTISYIFQDDKGRFFEMVVFTPTIDKDDLKKAIATWLGVLYFSILIGIIVVNRTTLRRSMRPLHRLLDWLDNFRLGAENAPLEMNSRITEFRRLGETAEVNMRRNEQLFEQQKLFIANSSHEMQTPLAVIQSRLEMLMDDGGLSEQQLGEIVKTLRTVENLSRTNRSLLLLCKIDNGQFTETSPVSLANVIRQLLPDMERVYSSHNISVSSYFSGDLTMEMSDVLANALISNLLKNAFVHNREGGSISVSIAENMLRIANTGQAEPLDKDRIFERFYHSPGKKSSTGLGLSIAAAICRLYSLSLEYRFVEGMHVFEIGRTS